MKQHIIFDDTYEGYSKEEKYIKNNWQEFNLTEPPDAETIENIIYDNIAAWYDAELMNLDKPVTLLALADLGLWNGRKKGYRIFDNLNDCLNYCRCDSIKVYVEGVTLKAELYHHDGTNYISFYIFDDNSDAAEKFLDDFCRGKKISKSRFYKYCKSAGKLVKKIYGF